MAELGWRDPERERDEPAKTTREQTTRPQNNSEIAFTRRNKIY